MSISLCILVGYEISLQILVLSSNTKKGEIERASSRSLVFCVLVNNTSDILNQVLSGAGKQISFVCIKHQKGEDWISLLNRKFPTGNFWVNRNIRF